MKYLLLLLLSSSLFAAEDPCSLNFDAATSVFDPNPKLYKSLSPLNKNAKKKLLTQTATTLKGTTITYTTGGCTHYAATFKIHPAKLNAQKPEDLFTQTVNELKDIPAKDKGEINILTDALDKKNWKKLKLEDGQYDLPCGDATCTLKTIKVKGVDSDIEISYDFPL